MKLPLHKKWLVLTTLIWIFLILVILTKVNISPILLNGVERTQTLYLLSTIAQSIAAVFALVFTISLIVAQLSSRYSHRMLEGFFDKYTIGFISIFLVTLILSFYLISEFNTNLVKFLLILAIACLLYLVPYFLQFRQKLNPEQIINKLEENAKRRLRKNSEMEPEEIATIDNFIMSAFVNRDYDSLESGVRSLGNLILESSRNNKGDLDNRYQEVTWIVSRRLRNICLVTIEDPRVPFEVVKAFENCGVGAINESLQVEKLPRWIGDELRYIGEKAIVKGLDELAQVITSSLAAIGKQATDKNYTPLIYTTVSALTQLAIRGLGKGLSKDFYELIYHLLNDFALFSIRRPETLLAKYLSRSLKEICMMAIDKKEVNIVNSGSSVLKTIGVEAINQITETSMELSDIAISIHKDLYSILWKAVNEEEQGEVLKEVSLTMSYLGIKAAQKNIRIIVNGVISNLGGVLEILYKKDSEFSSTIILEDPLAEHLISLIINFGALALEIDNERLKASVLETLNRIQKGTTIDEELIKKAFSNVSRYSPPYIDLLEAPMLIDNAEKLFSIYFPDTLQ